MTKLEKLGFYRYAARERIPQLKAEAAKTGYLYGGEHTRRDYLADSEDLAEGGVKHFLEEMQPFLEELGARIESIEEDFGEQSYSVEVNGLRHVIYTEDEFRDGNIWELATKRAFAILNDLLERAGSEERAYQLYGGNDLRLVFLTPAMYEAIQASNTLEEKEKPAPVRT